VLILLIIFISRASGWALFQWQSGRLTNGRLQRPSRCETPQPGRKANSFPWKQSTIQLDDPAASRRNQISTKFRHVSCGEGTGVFYAAKHEQQKGRAEGKNGRVFPADFGRQRVATMC